MTAEPPLASADGFLLFFAENRLALLAPDGTLCPWLSHALSLISVAVAARTARKYAHAVRRFCDAARSTAAQLESLGSSPLDARRTLSRMLVTAGCVLRHHRLHDGIVLVTAPPALVPCIDMTLSALSLGYDLLSDRGEWAFDNPVQTPPASAFLPDSGSRRPARHFLLQNQRSSLARTDIPPGCAAEIVEIARQWPAGVEAATWVTAKTGNRISETLGIRCRDWAQSGFADTIYCTNKGQGSRPLKPLYLDSALHDRLIAYVDGPRRQLTGIGWDDLRTLAGHDPDHPQVQRHLFLTSRGGRIAYSTYNDYYFRPTMRALSRPDTPHWLRHDHAMQALLALRELARDEGHFEQLVETYASLQGWRSGKQMVEYYAAPLLQAEQRALLADLLPALQRRLEEGAREPLASVAAPPAFRAFL